MTSTAVPRTTALLGSTARAAAAAPTSTGRPAAPELTSSALVGVDLSGALEDTCRVLDAVTDAQLGLATPCPGWDVRQVMAHIAEALGMFAGALGAEVAPAPDELPASADALALAVRAAACTTSAAWATQPADRTVPLPFGEFPSPLAVRINLLETYVHGCDVAWAIGRPDLVDEERCAAVRRMAEDAGFDAFRLPGMFGPAIAVGDERSELRQMLAYTGRSV